ncbi:MAG: ADP-ribosylglycohydrolase family protein [Pikeienuella sp.]
MVSVSETDKARAVVAGALVADAASMGFHWLYDQARIREVARQAPEFRMPNRADYGDKGYFAHEGKAAGMPSQYGAQMLTMARSLARTGLYDAADYAAEFRATFGYGGTWVGYIDRPTRVTLDGMAAAEAADKPLTSVGADDAQLPAVSKLPPLVAQHYDDAALPDMVESAVRVTNNRDDSVAWGQAVAAMIRAAIKGASPEEAVDAARGQSTLVDQQIDAALTHHAHSTAEVASAFALHCQLEVAFPVICHAIATATDYADAIRANIYAGGDNCGRSVPIGAVLGACFAGTERGVPPKWTMKTEPSAVTML